jgi:hypothetical protein
MLRSIRPKRARAGLQKSLNRPEKTVVFRHLSEYGSVRASDEHLLAAYAMIAAWPKGGTMAGVVESDATASRADG